MLDSAYVQQHQIYEDTRPPHIPSATETTAAAALGRLFTANGDLDMATKCQDTLASDAWIVPTAVPGLAG